MVPDFVPLYAVVIVLLCLGYFAMASIPFLFVRLDIPEVSRLFRGLFDIYFWMIGVTGLVAAVAFAASGRLAFAAGLLLLAATAMVVRTRVLARIDTQQTAWQAGDTRAMQRLRVIHWSGMLANIVVIVTVAASLPFIL